MHRAGQSFLCYFFASLFIFTSHGAQSNPLMTEQGSFRDGNAFIDACEGFDGREDCSLIVLGFLTGISIYQYWLVDAEIERNTWPDLLPFCVPKAASIYQIVDVFLKYLQDNPARRHELWILLLRDSVREAWPCSE